MTIKWSYLGLTEFESALKLQHELRTQVLEGGKTDYLLLLSHPPTITRGYSERSDAGLVEPRERLEAEGIKIIDVDRGGRTTYHGPDQLIGYMIFDLKRRKLKTREFVQKVAEAIVTMLDSYGIESFYDESDPGVMVGPAKIAFLGFNIQKEVTTHGFALNVGRDIKAFSYIVPCGKMGRKITSMEELVGRAFSTFDVYWRVVTALGAGLGEIMEEVAVEADLIL